MASLELEAFPGRKLDLLLFHEVTNSAHLLTRLQSGTLEPEVALLNARLVPGTFPVLVAAHKALTSASMGSLKSRTLHSELVYNYAASKHIRESLQRCGVAAGTSAVLAAKFDATEGELAAIRALVKGTEIDIASLSTSASHADIIKHFKIAAPEMAVWRLEDAIVARIGVRDSW
ncbi:hypothetical protein CLOM_g12353 [Closterium sp. NIES-68]|nr:hypothetical protein CLOM_g21578 [Closterium sp. NIES-68]GJP53164.1 hypothetical protein CLOM_g12353 [Closterium sp. NIES-68]GJP71367.1 hypothetical protein CLOP_g2206 [Closterium sp. NIES-67]